MKTGRGRRRTAEMGPLNTLPKQGRELRIGRNGGSFQEGGKRKKIRMKSFAAFPFQGYHKKKREP